MHKTVHYIGSWSRSTKCSPSNCRIVELEKNMAHTQETAPWYQSTCSDHSSRMIQFWKLQGWRGWLAVQRCLFGNLSHSRYFTPGQSNIISNSSLKGGRGTPSWPVWGCMAGVHPADLRGVSGVHPAGLWWACRGIHPADMWGCMAGVHPAALRRGVRGTPSWHARGARGTLFLNKVFFHRYT